MGAVGARTCRQRSERQLYLNLIRGESDSDSAVAGQSCVGCVGVESDSVSRVSGSAAAGAAGDASRWVRPVRPACATCGGTDPAGAVGIHTHTHAQIRCTLRIPGSFAADNNNIILMH